MQLQDAYFAAYRNLKLTRDGDGVLVVEFTPRAGRSSSRHKVIRSLSRLILNEPINEFLSRQQESICERS
jgi:hypothetical protein